jgi:hypothetical protein
LEIKWGRMGFWGADSLCFFFLFDLLLPKFCCLLGIIVIYRGLYCAVTPDVFSFVGGWSGPEAGAES